MKSIRRICVLVAVMMAYLAMTEAKLCLTSSGRSFRCSDDEDCCGDTCCYMGPYDDTFRSLKWSVWNMWYFWFIVIFIMMTCFGTCGYWRRRHIMLASQQRHGVTTGSTPTPYATGSHYHHSGAPMSQPAITVLPGFEVGYLDDGRRVVTTSPRVVTSSAAPDSLTDGMFPAPPPYSEVVSKPDLYRPNVEKEGLPPYPGDGQGDGSYLSSIVIGQPTGATAHVQTTANQTALSSATITSSSTNHEPRSGEPQFSNVIYGSNNASGDLTRSDQI